MTLTDTYGTGYVMNIQVYECPQHISVCWSGENIGERATAEVDHFPYDGEEGRWHIARVLVQPASARGQGIGYLLMKNLKQAVRGQGGTHLTVDPGGYGVDPEKQRAFYRKCGFEAHDTEEGRMVCWLKE